MLNIYRKLDPTKESFTSIDPKFFVGTAIWPILMAVRDSGSLDSLSPQTYAVLTVMSGLLGLKVGVIYHSWKRWLSSWRVRWNRSRTKSKSRSTSRKRTTKNKSKLKLKSNRRFTNKNSKSKGRSTGKPKRKAKVIR